MMPKSSHFVCRVKQGHTWKLRIRIKFGKKYLQVTTIFLKNSDQPNEPMDHIDNDESVMNTTIF